MDQINKYLCYKWKLNGVNVVKQSDGTLWDSYLKPNLFNADKLHLIKERNAKLAVSIYNSINLNAGINKGVWVSSKLFCNTCVKRGRFLHVTL